MIDFQKYINKAIYLPVEEFANYFDKLWDEMSKSFKKFESLQSYDESNECPLYDLLNNDFTSFSHKLLNSKEEEKEFYVSALSKGVNLERLHFIKFPISDYIKFEYYSYYISNSLGENIMFDDIEKYTNLKLKDFIIFDNEHLLIHDYTENGKLRGGWYLVGDDVKELEQWYNEAIKKANQFIKITLPNKDILDFIL